MDRLKGFIEERYDSLAQFIQKMDNYKKILNNRENCNQTRSSISIPSSIHFENIDLSKTIIQEIGNFKDLEKKRVDEEQLTLMQLQFQEIDLSKEIYTFYDYSINSIRRIDEQFYYFEKFNGTFDELVQLYKTFFQKLKETQKLNEIDLIQQQSALEKIPVFLILFKWLFDLSRIKVERIINQKSQELILEIKVSKKSIPSQYQENLKNYCDTPITLLNNENKYLIKQGNQDDLTSIKNLSIMKTLNDERSIQTKKHNQVRLSVDGRIQTEGLISSYNNVANLNLSSDEFINYLHVINKQTIKKHSSISSSHKKRLKDLFGQSTENTSKNINHRFSKLISSPQQSITTDISKNSKSVSSDKKQKQSLQISSDENSIDTQNNTNINQFKYFSDYVQKDNELKFSNCPYKIIINEQNEKIENQLITHNENNNYQNIEHTQNLLFEKNPNLIFMKILSENDEQYQKEQIEKQNQCNATLISTSESKKNEIINWGSAQKQSSNYQESLSNNKKLENYFNDEDKTKTSSFEKTTSNIRKIFNNSQNQKYHKFKRGPSYNTGSSVNLSFQEQNQINGSRYNINYQKYLFDNNSSNINKRYGNIKANMHNIDNKNLLDLDILSKVFHYQMRKISNFTNNEVSENGKNIMLNQFLQRNQNVKQTIDEYYKNTQFKFAQQINSASPSNNINKSSNSNNQNKEKKPTTSQKKNRRKSSLNSISQTTPVSQFQQKVSYNQRRVNTSNNSSIIEVSKGNLDETVFQSIYNANNNFQLHDNNLFLDQIQASQLNSQYLLLNDKKQLIEKRQDSNLKLTSKNQIVQLQNLNKTVDFELYSSDQRTRQLSIDEKQDLSQDMIFRNVRKENQKKQRKQRINTIGHEPPKNNEIQNGKIFKIQNQCANSQRRSSFMSYPISIDESYIKQKEFNQSKNKFNIQILNNSLKQDLNIKNKKFQIPTQNNQPHLHQNVFKQSLDISSYKLQQNESKQQQQLNMQTQYLQQLKLQQQNQQQLNQQQFESTEYASKTQSNIKVPPMVSSTHKSNRFNINVRSVVNNFKQQYPPQIEQSQKTEISNQNVISGKQRVQIEYSDLQIAEREVQENYYANKNHRRRMNSQRNNENLIQLSKQDTIGIQITNMNQITDFSNQVNQKTGCKQICSNNKSISYSTQLMQMQDNSMNFIPSPFTNQEIQTKIDNYQQYQYQQQQFQAIPLMANSNNIINHYNKLVQKITSR